MLNKNSKSLQTLLMCYLPLKGYPQSTFKVFSVPDWGGKFDDICKCRFKFSNLREVTKGSICGYPARRWQVGVLLEIRGSKDKFSPREAEIKFGAF